MSAIGTKRTSLFAPHMSAIVAKSDIGGPGGMIAKQSLMDDGNAVLVSFC
jgi:hypothetical protein